VPPEYPSTASLTQLLNRSSSLKNPTQEIFEVLALFQVSLVASFNLQPNQNNLPQFLPHSSKWKPSQWYNAQLMI
jgi:hypothetical protein